jgi:hypothetical protein
MAISKKAKKLVDSYIVQKVLDPEERVNKSTKMRNAGYSEQSVSKSISTIESGKYFAEMASNLANKTGTVANYLSNSIEESVLAGELESYDLKDKVLIYKTIIQICSVLTPSFRQKTEVDSKNEELRKTIWSTIN